MYYKAETCIFLLRRYESKCEFNKRKTPTDKPVIERSLSTKIRNTTGGGTTNNR